ncbi:MAG: thiamine diphosphokinase [Ruminococcus sp.]|nr:thiamine diphosphokinase [Ruminococcus sp.]MDE7225432.1 thiamine diphosphokinase [Ruminococcus sp.]
MTAVIFAGGIIECTDFIDIDEIKSADLIICADRGYLYAQTLGIAPDIVMGDFDSYNGEISGEFEIYRSIPEKDDTDTLLAVRTAIERGCTEIRLYGALGARFDHSFANIQTLLYARRKSCAVTIIDSDNEITVQGAGERRYPYRENWYFSIFALTDTAVIGEFSGVKYPLKNYSMTTDYPIGVSNEIISDEAVLRVDSGIILVIRSMNK